MNSKYIQLPFQFANWIIPDKTRHEICLKEMHSYRFLIESGFLKLPLKGDSQNALLLGWCSSHFCTRPIASLIAVSRKSSRKPLVPPIYTSESGKLSIEKPIKQKPSAAKSKSFIWRNTHTVYFSVRPKQYSFEFIALSIIFFTYTYLCVMRHDNYINHISLFLSLFFEWLFDIHVKNCTESSKYIVKDKL